MIVQRPRRLDNDPYKTCQSLNGQKTGADLELS